VFVARCAPNPLGLKSWSVPCLISVPAALRNLLACVCNSTEPLARLPLRREPKLLLPRRHPGPGLAAWDNLSLPGAPLLQGRGHYLHRRSLRRRLAERSLSATHSAAGLLGHSKRGMPSHSFPWPCRHHLRYPFSLLPHDCQSSRLAPV